jgi:Kef-type K+ transport system membrane component KefB
LKIEDVSVLLFLPIFFAFTGLRTQIGLLVSDGLWEICLLVLVVAVAGKIIGTVTAAKLMNQTWKNSFALGALMNTRGLMELVVLNIGYDLGVISPEIFVVLVIMAVVTTLMTGPLLNLIDWIWKEKPMANAEVVLD